MKGQLRELLTNYGPIGIIWFDGGWEHNAQELHSREVNAMIRSLQPSIIINDRNRLPEDYSTPEQNIPANALPGGRLWETCMTINDTWGYAKNDTNWKSAEDLIRKLCDITSKGGNFLLNVGPTAEGEFPEAINERLGRISAWMKVNGESIYGTTKSPFRKLPFDGRCTAKGNTLYLHVFRWPSDGLTLTGLKTAVLDARALNGSERLNVTPAPGSDTSGPKALSIAKPKKLDPIATVIELRLSGPPVVVEPGPVAKAGADGNFVLEAGDAEIHGRTARYDWQGVNREDYIGSWTNSQDYVTWTVDVPQAGRYRVQATYACPPGNEGSRFTVGVENGAKVAGTVKRTSSEADFRTEPLGQIQLPAGQHTLAVRIAVIPSGSAMNLHEVRLVPVR